MHTLLAYRVGVACLSQVRLSGSGHTPIAVPQQDTTFHPYHSGTTDNTSQHGVGIALSATANASLLDWAPFSTRLAEVRLKGETANVSIIAEYAPTLDADDIVKDAFYSRLQAMMMKYPPVIFWWLYAKGMPALVRRMTPRAMFLAASGWVPAAPMENY